MLDAADVLVDGHPGVGLFRIEGGACRCAGRCSAWYQLEHVNVSMVSVSRLAGLPQTGQVVFTNPAWWPRLAGGQVDVLGQAHGRSSSGTGTTPHFSQWMAGMGLPQ